MKGQGETKLTRMKYEKGREHIFLLMYCRISGFYTTQKIGRVCDRVCQGYYLYVIVNSCAKKVLNLNLKCTYIALRQRSAI